MADKATDAAAKKAAEKGVDLEQVEGSGAGGKVTAADVEKADEKSLYHVNPTLGSWRAVFYPDGVPKEFYQDPNQHPAGSDAQLLTEEEFAQFKNEQRDGVPVLIKLGGES